MVLAKIADRTYLSLLLLLILLTRLGLWSLGGTATNTGLAKDIVLWVSLEVLIGNLSLDHSGSDLLLVLIGEPGAMVRYVVQASK